MADIDPTLREALAALRADRPDTAEAILLHRVRNSPEDPDAWHLIGHARLVRGDVDGAWDPVERALALRPAFAEAQNTLGSLHRTRGEHEAALRAFEAAIALRPDFAEAHLNLGLLLGSGGNATRAEAAYRRAIALAPRLAAAHRGLAAALLGQGRLGEAEAAARAALRIAPDAPTARVVLGRVREQQGRAGIAGRRYEEAIAALREALAMEPGRWESVALLLRALHETCDWAAAAPLERSLREESARRRRTNEPPVATPDIVTWDTDAPLHRDLAVQWSRALASGIAPRAHAPRPRRTRLRVGYLSADFRDHATAHLIGGLFRRHDRARFAVHAYAYGPADDGPVRTRLAREADAFLDVEGASDQEAAARIAADGVDILVDLKGHTAGARLGICAHRPAPVQATWLGWPGTTGAAFVDYVLGDAVVTPAEAEADFTERIVRLPGSYQITDDRQPVVSEPVVRTEVGLPEDAFVFGGFHQPYKITSAMWRCWMRLLAEVPGSVLWLYRANVVAARRLFAAARAAGVSPERIRFADWAEKPRHLARLCLVDLALDTQPCCGHTTTSDALYAGVPVIVQRGTHFAGRVGESLLRAAGLADLVAADADAYDALALSLAHDACARAAIRRRLATARRSEPYFDTARFVRALERAYDAMWSRFESGQPPVTMDVAAEGTDVA